jgi:hypothetical protein
VNEQTNQLTNNFSELRAELIASKEEMESKLNVSKIEILLSDQMKKIETLMETQTKIVNTLISANMASYTCPSDWQKYLSYCYLYVKEYKTFSEARAHCKRLGATLCDIENEAENTIIASIRVRVWVGIYYEEKEGHWISERTGQPASYTYVHMIILTFLQIIKYISIIFGYNFGSKITSKETCSVTFAYLRQRQDEAFNNLPFWSRENLRK